MMNPPPFTPLDTTTVFSFPMADHVSGQSRLAALGSHHGASRNKGHWTTSVSLENGGYAQFNDAVVTSQAMDLDHQQPVTTLLLYVRTRAGVLAKRPG